MKIVRIWAKNNCSIGRRRCGFLAKQVDAYNDQYLDKQTEVSDLTAQINYMETDKTLSKLRHEYYNLKNRMNDLAKDWASLSYLEGLINEHIKQIKDKRLPQVINEL